MKESRYLDRYNACNRVLFEAGTTEEAHKNDFSFQSASLQQVFVNNVIKEELSEIYFDIDLQESIYEELIDEAKKWYVFED